MSNLKEVIKNPEKLTFDPDNPQCPVCHQGLYLEEELEWSENPIENVCFNCALKLLVAMQSLLKEAENTIENITKTDWRCKTCKWWQKDNYCKEFESMGLCNNGKTGLSFQVVKESFGCRYWEGKK